MGVSLGEVLKSKYFNDYKVLAGSKGLDKEVQAVTVFDAPDGYLWFRGKEWVLSSGYLFIDNIKLFKDVIIHLSTHNSAGLGIKPDRYLKTVPKEIIELCDSLDFPLIYIPFSEAWIDVINAVNSVAINRFITSVIDKTPHNISSSRTNNLKIKIQDLIICLYNEIKHPISLFDMNEKTVFNYPNTTYDKDLIFNKEETYSFSYQKEIICDRLNIYRITNLDKKSHCPWIEIPIVLRGMIVAKIFIWEENNSIDYYDLFALRLTCALLLEIYEQVYMRYSYEGRFYDEFLQGLIDGSIDTKSKVIKNTNSLNNFLLDIDKNLICISIKQEEGSTSFYHSREKLYNSVLFNLPRDKCIFGIMDDDIISIIYDASDFTGNSRNKIKSKVKSILNDMELTFPQTKFIIGIGDVAEDILYLKKSYIESLKAMEIGSYIYPNEKILAFEDLGPFGILRFESIQSKSFGSSFNSIFPLLKEVDKDELINTLKVYLESQSNCNEAAKKLFLHSNTIRYRISKIQEICKIDLNDPIERLKMEITLKFINMINTDNQAKGK